MKAKAWIVKKGDTLIVHTTYAKGVFKAYDILASDPAGGVYTLFAVKSVTAYMHALVAKGYDVDFTVPA